MHVAGVKREKTDASKSRSFRFYFFLVDEVAQDF